MAELDAAGQQLGLQGQELPNGVGDQMGSESRNIAGGNDADVAEGVASLKMILGEDLPDEQAANLLRIVNGDINAAVELYFDSNGAVAFGVPAGDPTATAVPQEAELTEADRVLNELAVLSMQDDNAGPRSPLIAPPEFLSSSGSADRGPETTGARENESEDMHVGNGRAEMGNGVERPRRRRPGTAPPTRQAGQDEEALEVKMEALRCVLGADTSDEVLRQLLRSTGGDVQMALEAFFDNEGNSFVFVGAGDAAGSPDEAPPVSAPARRGARRRQQREQEEPGPRKPFEDLALMLGNGVKANILGPIMVETQGDVPRSLELYCQRTADPKFREEAAQRDPSVSAEEYYLRPEKAVPVMCNVYDLSWGAEEKDGKKKKVNSGLPGMGFGIYHSGIEVYGREVSFGFSDDGSTGVFEVPSRCAGGVMPRITFKEAHVMGEIVRSRYEVDHLLARLAEKFQGDSYDLVRRNCNHFANEL